MHYDTVIFDMDGTLVDTDLMLVESIVTLLRKYRPLHKISLSEIIYFSGPPIEDTLKRLFPDLDHATIVQEFKDTSFKFYELDTMLFPYAHEALHELKELGINIGILTNKHHDRTIDTLKMLGIEHLFDIIIGYDDVVNSKPHPEGMMRIIEYYQANPKKILFLGDTIYDYEVARNSGVASGLIGWSLRKFPSDVQPDIWLNDYRDLVEVVKYGTKKI